MSCAWLAASPTQTPHITAAFTSRVSLLTQLASLPLSASSSAAPPSRISPSVFVGTSPAFPPIYENASTGLPNLCKPLCAAPSKPVKPFQHISFYFSYFIIYECLCLNFPYFVFPFSYPRVCRCLHLFFYLLREPFIVADYRQVLACALPVSSLSHSPDHGPSLVVHRNFYPLL